MPTPGDLVRVVMTKWVDRPHWEFDCRFLGSDEHGDWLGISAGTRMARPGATYIAPTDQVGLLWRLAELRRDLEVLDLPVAEHEASATEARRNQNAHARDLLGERKSLRW